MTVLVRSYPFVAAGMARLIGRAAAPEPEVLQSQEEEAVTPPVLLPGQIDRIVWDDTAEHRMHLDNLSATSAIHAPVLRWHYRNALVWRGGFATPRHGESYMRPRIGSVFGHLHHEATLRYCHSQVAFRYFGHWLSDSLPAALIDPGLGAAWLPADAVWSHAPDYAGILGLAPLQRPLVQADDLIVYQDFSQGSHKRARCDLIRGRLRASLTTTTGPECVYVRRNKTGAPRMIADEDKLIEDLAGRGWAILDMTTATVATILATLSHAKVAVGIEGSHLAHLHVGMPVGGILVILVPQDRFSTVHLGRARSSRAATGFVVLLRNAAGHYIASLSEILATVDLAAARGSHG